MTCFRWEGKRTHPGDVLPGPLRMNAGGAALRQLCQGTSPAPWVLGAGSAAPPVDVVL